MRRAVALLAAALLGAGCRRVIALGDSNTCGTRPCGDAAWPTYLADRVWYRGWRVVNRGAPGMSAGRLYRGDGNDIRNDLGDYTFAAYHVEKLLEEEKLARACRWLWHPAWAPVVVIALGTNDLLDHDGDTIAADILAVDARLREVAPCVRVLVGLVPPRKDIGEPIPSRVARANAVLRARVPPERLLDFNSVLADGGLMMDGVHLQPEGRRRWAELVRQRLVAGIAAPSDAR